MVTSFDNHFFKQGLNLIAGLHRTSPDLIDRILVYDLGLDKRQAEFLNLLQKVRVLAYPFGNSLVLP